MDEQMGENKKSFSFKQYYYANPEFREKHLARLREHVTCECGCIVSRSNFSKHKKNKKHFRKMVENSSDPEVKKTIEELMTTYEMALNEAKKKYFEK